jgi:hypothetical protein
VADMYAFEHASAALGVAPVPGALKSDGHASFPRAMQVATSPNAAMVPYGAHSCSLLHPLATRSVHAGSKLMPPSPTLPLLLLLLLPLLLPLLLLPLLLLPLLPLLLPRPLSMRPPLLLLPPLLLPPSSPWNPPPSAGGSLEHAQNEAITAEPKIQAPTLINGPSLFKQHELRRWPYNSASIPGREPRST